jgi:hypothetical protein
MVPVQFFPVLLHLAAALAQQQTALMVQLAVLAAAVVATAV